MMIIMVLDKIKAGYKLGSKTKEVVPHDPSTYFANLVFADSHNHPMP